VVDDGSKDGTAAVAEYFQVKIPTLRVLSNGVNRGKGYSVRHGMQEARGRIALFTDADLSAPIEEAGKLIDALETNDVAIGSRAMDRSLITVHESPFREFAGIIFNKIVRTILWLPFVDTQCGFKAFQRERCGILFEQQTIERFGFDPELLYLARRHGLRAVEIPVRWGHSPATKVSMLHDSIQMFIDVFTIRSNSLKGRYPRNDGECGRIYRRAWLGRGGHGGYRPGGRVCGFAANHTSGLAGGVAGGSVCGSGYRRAGCGH
jgi:glycosyltransferase involved in cell wall biosynthesis